MHAKLLLPSAKSGVLLEPPKPSISPWWRYLAITVGIVAVFVGAADAISRLSAYAGNVNFSFSAFAPAALVLEPELLQRVQPSATFEPTRLLVPSINVDAAVEHVGTKQNGAMDTPKTIKNVAWYKPGAKPGAPGNAVFAGHLNSSLGATGVFKNLSNVKRGDEVVVRGGPGEELTYLVEEVHEYTHDEAPLAQIFAMSGPSGLVLITCEGTWDTSAKTYDKRLVVVARLVP